MAASRNDTLPSGKDIECELSSFRTELRDISDTMKRLVSTSAACSDKISTIPEISAACSTASRISSECSAALARISTTQNKHASKLEALDLEMGKVKQTATNQAKDISTSVHNEIKNLERKITSQVKEAVNTFPANEIRVSVQEELVIFKEEIIAKVEKAIKPTAPDPSSSSKAVSQPEPVKPVPNVSPVKSTAT